MSAPLRRPGVESALVRNRSSTRRAPLTSDAFANASSVALKATTSEAAVPARGTHDESIRLSHRSAVAGCAARAHAAMTDA